MKFFFVGLDLRSQTHDYTQIHAVLKLLHARRVSPRIWLCAVHDTKSDHIFALTRTCLAPQDDMLVVEMPSSMQIPALFSIAA